jgi:transposase
MKHNDTSTTAAVASTQPVNHLAQARTLKLALDVQLLHRVVAMQCEGTSPKPPQRFSPQDFLKWVARQIAAGWKVVSCYEAGPFGYGLHRQLTGLGATNYVIRPRNWDEQHKRVKTGRTDALAMLNALDRFVAGNPHALALVRVPTQEQERLRSQSRIRQGLKRDLKVLAQRGRGLALQYGYRLKGRWYGARNWPTLPLPDWLIELLSPLRAAALALHQQVRLQGQRLEAQSLTPRPKGMGALSEQVIEREIGDWHRSSNRRQVVRARASNRVL